MTDGVKTTGEHHYSLSDIDRMRRAVRHLLIQHNQSYYPAEMNANVEDRVRTCMQGGIRPEELETQVGERMRSEWEWQERMRAERAS